VAAYPGGFLRLLVGSSGDLDAADGPLDIELDLGSGGRYVGTVATLGQLQQLLDRWRTTGECLAGGYIWMRHLIIVSELTLHQIVAVVLDLERTAELARALEFIPPTALADDRRRPPPK
jgi:hypothetical protein